MMDELDCIVLTEDLPEESLQAVDLGAILLVHESGGDYEGPEGYTVEFTESTAETRAVVGRRLDQVRPDE